MVQMYILIGFGPTPEFISRSDTMACSLSLGDCERNWVLMSYVTVTLEVCCILAGTKPMILPTSSILPLPVVRNVVWVCCPQTLFCSRNYCSSHRAELVPTHNIFPSIRNYMQLTLGLSKDTWTSR